MCLIIEKMKMMFSMRYACLKCWCGAWGLFSNSRITFVFLRVRCGVFLPSSFLGAEQFYAESMLQKALMYSF